MFKSTAKISILLSTLALSACKTDIQPEWENYFTLSNANDERVEWLNDLVVDSYGDVIAGGSTVLVGPNRKQNILLTKHDSNGSLQWSFEHDLGNASLRSDDKITDMVLDDDGNIYAVGVRYIVENNADRYGSFLLKVNRYGELAWVKEISNQEDARDIEIQADKLYVTGYATQVFNLNGQRTLNITHEKAWDIEVDQAGAMYIVGASKASKYSASGNLIWSSIMPAGLELRASLAINSDGSVLVAHNQEDRSARLAMLSAQGRLLWSKKYNQAVQSYGFPGPALVKVDWRGDIIFSLSNDQGRRIVKLNNLGREDWQATSKGILHDFALDDDGAVYAVGGGINEKYDRSGKLLASTVKTSSPQITTGSIALDGDSMYVGYSAVNNGDIQLYIAKFIDQ